MAKWPWEPTQKKTYRKTSTFHASDSSGWEWSRLLTNSESDRDRMFVDRQSWVIETTGTEHSPPVATVLVAAPSGWSSVVLLVQYLQNLHDCFVPLHCQCCIISALRTFHVNLLFGLGANYNDWYVHDFIQSVHITHSFKCLNLRVHTVTTTLLTANHCQ